MKFPFVLASACFISGLLYPITVHANAIAISSAEAAISRPPPAAKAKAPPNKVRVGKESNKPAVAQSENVSVPKPQVTTSVAEEPASQQARSFLLLLHILQGAK